MEIFPPAPRVASKRSKRQQIEKGEKKTGPAFIAAVFPRRPLLDLERGLFTWQSFGCRIFGFPLPSNIPPKPMLSNRSWFLSLRLSGPLWRTPNSTTASGNPQWVPKSLSPTLKTKRSDIFCYKFPTSNRHPVSTGHSLAATSFATLGYFECS